MSVGRRVATWIPVVVTLVLGGAATAVAVQPPAVLVVVVDTLRADRLSVNGYGRATSPEIDALVRRGAHLVEARTAEPLTAPAMVSAFTGLEPHRHGATRNGLLMEPGLDSLPKQLAADGWDTAAFFSNWTLKDRLTGLGEHFEVYESVFTRRRWFGLFNREATAEDVTDAALTWLEEHRRQHRETPVFLWVHYVEPHAPYRFHEEYAQRLRIETDRPDRADRYDTEIAAVDAEVGRLVREVERLHGDTPPLIVFLADHGESLGEHNEWGHGRDLYEPGVRVPLAFVWEGVIPPSTLHGPAVLPDVAPTLAGLLGRDMEGLEVARDWSAAVRGDGSIDPERALCLQAHKGAVKGDHDSDRARSRGLLSVAVVRGHRKEILVLRDDHLEVYDLTADPRELHDLAGDDTERSDALMTCVGEVTTELGRLDRLATRQLDPESVEQLRALGYLE